MNSSKELQTVLNQELDDCIKKLRNAKSGREVRTFITEYEELMFKKSDAIVKEALKTPKEDDLTELQEEIKKEDSGSKEQSRQALYISVSALFVSITALTIQIIMALQ